jgi:hypothetical protein
LRGRVGVGIGVAAVAAGVTLAASGVSIPAAVRVQSIRPSGQAASRPAFFYANVGNLIPGTKFSPNPPLVRPSRLIEFEDGSWLIVNLRWTGWGGSTALATGISSASNCKPNCAAGKRTHDRAQLAVSQPKRFLGRTVYTCFQLTIPAAPKANQHDCLGREGGLYGYQPAAGSHVQLASFLSSDRKIWCQLNNETYDRSAACGTSPSDNTGVYAAQVSASGQVNLCSWAPSQGTQAYCGFQNWDNNAPVLRSGYVDLVYQYRCTSTASSVTCTVNTGPGKGNGFRITRTSVSKLTP